MKLLTIDAPPAGHPAVLMGNGEVVDLTGLGGLGSAAAWIPGSVRQIIEAGDEGLEILRRRVGAVEGATQGELDRLREKGIVRKFDATPLAPAIPDPRLIMSAGLNYGRHLAEMSNTPRPQYPTAFIKAQSSLTGSGKPVTAPPQADDMIDYEGEFTFVVKHACHRVSEADAMNHVFGYTLANDISARNWVEDFFKAEGKFPSLLGWERNVMGKQLPGFTPLGPVIVTKDEIKDPYNLHLTTTLNGQVMQDTKTDDLIFKVEQLLSYFSNWYTFSPGDLFTTGSPSGVGFGRDPKVFMHPGDTVEVECEGVGKLVNTIVKG